MSNHKESEEDTEKPKAQTATPTVQIGTATPIQLGVLLTLLSGIVIGSWKLSSMSTKIDLVLKTTTELIGKTDSVQQKLAAHEQDDTRQWTDVKARVLALETSGSPPLREMMKDLAELKARLEVHEKTHKP